MSRGRFLLGAGAARRKFGALVENEIVEDYSLRYAPRTFGRWGEYTVATAALGGIAYLVDFVIGGSLMVTHGFSSAIWGYCWRRSPSFSRGYPSPTTPRSAT